MDKFVTWARKNIPILLGVALVVVAFLVVWPLPSLLTRHPRVTGADRHKAVSDARNGLVALLVAVGAAGGLAFHRRSAIGERHDSPRSAC